jgi:hypothetical protein
MDVLVMRLANPYVRRRGDPRGGRRKPRGAVRNRDKNEVRLRYWVHVCGLDSAVLRSPWVCRGRCGTLCPPGTAYGPHPAAALYLVPVLGRRLFVPCRLEALAVFFLLPYVFLRL